MITGVNLFDQLREKLKELRKRHDLTQEEFASVADINYKFYQQIESGRKDQIWLSTVEKLAQAYGLEVWEILSPKLPEKTKLVKKPLASKVHYKSTK